MTYIGMLRSTVSWARVNREVCLALAERRDDLKILELRGFRYDPDMILPEKLEQRIVKECNSDISICLDYPPNYHRLKGSRKIALLVYESSRLPDKWVRSILRHIDLLVAPSRHNLKIFEQSGISRDKLALAPYGVNRSVFMPTEKKRNREKFVFLSVGTPHVRKGFDVLLSAYLRAFTADDPVKLVLKLPFDSNAERKKRFPWENGGTTKMVERMTYGFEDSPEIEVKIGEMPDQELVKLYQDSDLYVMPSRSEGFGLAVLEAFAAGCPAAVSGWGGHMDFCNCNNSFIIDSTMASAGEAQYDNEDEKALVCDPSVENLSDIMIQSFHNPKLLAIKRRCALKTADRYSWGNTADKMLELMRMLEK